MKIPMISFLEDCVDIIFPNEKTLLERCEKDDEYLDRRNKFIASAFLCSVLPVIIAVLFSFGTSNFNITSLIKQGDLLLIFYSLIATTTIDIINTNKGNVTKSRLNLCKYMSLFLTIVDLIAYVIIKCGYEWWSQQITLHIYLFATLVLAFNSSFLCIFIIKIMYINEEGGI